MYRFMNIRRTKVERCKTWTGWMFNWSGCQVHLDNVCHVVNMRSVVKPFLPGIIKSSPSNGVARLPVSTAQPPPASTPWQP